VEDLGWRRAKCASPLRYCLAKEDDAFCTAAREEEWLRGECGGRKRVVGTVGGRAPLDCVGDGGNDTAREGERE